MVRDAYIRPHHHAEGRRLAVGRRLGCTRFSKWRFWAAVSRHTPLSMFHAVTARRRAGEYDMI